jgi:hypothetical protein
MEAEIRSQSPERLRAEFDHIVSMWRSQIRMQFWSVVIRSAKETAGRQSPRAFGRSRVYVNDGLTTCGDLS